MHADVRYYESLDPFTDEEIYYVYGESVNNEFLTFPAYFKIMYLKEEDEMLFAFNSEYINFAFDEYCKVKQSERNPSLGYFTFDLDNDSDFTTDMFIWDDENPGLPLERKKLLIRFPGEEPIEFNLKGSLNAFHKFMQKSME